eukprot:TRINITY_DN3670_c0_g1_i1.p1 TRINITY_DN3670_c0_g1~~TRINITY_DN3670_c0_g1_i1.p1  ORF type:complete len:271 (-),score=55.54 TRINITY_DN3670_c0_g1_i1:44-856(-)
MSGGEAHKRFVFTVACRILKQGILAPEGDDCLQHFVPYPKPIEMHQLSKKLPMNNCLIVKPQFHLKEGEAFVLYFNTTFSEINQGMFSAEMAFSGLYAENKDGSIPTNLKTFAPSTTGITVLYYDVILNVTERDSGWGEKPLKDLHGVTFEASQVNVKRRPLFNETLRNQNKDLRWGVGEVYLMPRAFVYSQRINYVPYTSSDLLGAMGGVLNLATAFILLWVGKGLYNPYGLLHRLGVLRKRFEDTEPVKRSEELSVISSKKKKGNNKA